MHLAFLSVMKRIALSVFNNQMATVLDYSPSLLLVTLDGDQVQGRLEVSVGPAYPGTLLRALQGFQVDVLICGAVSSSLLDSLTRRGIEVISCVRGPLDQVLRAYVQGTLPARRFRLPGAPAARPSLGGRRSGRRWNGKEAER